MKQFIIRNSFDPDGRCTISGRDFHYLSRVRRMTLGSVLDILTTEGLSGKAEIIGFSDESLELQLVSPNSQQVPDTRPGISLGLLLGYPKGKKLEQSIRQAVELGVRDIFPIVCDHSIPDVDHKDWLKKSQRLQVVIGEAVQQSGLLGIPTLHPPQTVDTFLVSNPLKDHQRGIFFHEKPLAEKFFAEYLVDNPSQVYVFVGPEGGISDREVKLLQSKGFVPGYLGPTVLRCETAVVAALAVVSILGISGNYSF